MNWKNISVFVSSTFIDMDVERDALKNIVEPRLNRHLSQYRCSLDFIDLRHNVATERTLSILERERLIFSTCFDEIKRCSPYFIGFLGHRYGWVPSEDGVDPPEDIILPDSFPIDKKSLSVTASEFLSAINLYTGENSNAIRPLIYLRSNDSYDGLSDSCRLDYVDSDSEDSNIDRLREFFTSRYDIADIKEYSLPRTDDGVETADISEWSDMIYSDVLRLIAPELEDIQSEEETPERKLLREYHDVTDAVMQFHLKKFQGRDNEIKEFMIKLESRKNLILYAPIHGIGASAFLCKITDILAANPLNVAFFFPQESVMSWSREDIPGIMASGLREKIAQLGLSESRPITDKTFDDIQQSIAIINKAGFKAYFIFDCQVDPNYFIRLECSCVYNLFSEGLDSFLRPFSYELPALHLSTSSLVICHLRSELRQALLKKTGAENVRWLNIAMNIIDRINRLDFDVIRKRPEADNEEKIVAHQLGIISSMSSNVAELMSSWIRRIAVVLGEDATYKILYLLKENPYGWTESEISLISGADPVLVSMVVMSAGEELVLISNDGSISMDTTYAKVIDNLLSRDQKLEIKQKALDYVLTLPSGHPRHAEVLFNLAMQCGRHDVCNKFIEVNEAIPDEFNEDAMESFTDYARNSPLDFLRFFNSLISGPYVPSSRRYYRNLLEWCKNLWEPKMTEVYLNTLNLISQRLTANYNNRLISLYAYAVKCEIIACMFDYYLNKKNYGMVNKTLKEGLDISALHSDENSWWLYYRIYFIYHYSFTFQSKDEQIKWFQTMFDPLERSGIEFPPYIDTSKYIACLSTSTLLRAMEMDEQSILDVLKKVTALLQSLYENWQKKIVETRDSLDFLFNHIFSVAMAFLNMGTAGVITNKSALLECVDKLVALYENHPSGQIDARGFSDKIYGYLTILVNRIRLTDASHETKVRAIYEGVVKKTLGKYDNDIFPGFLNYIIIERNRDEISNLYREIIYAIAVILDFLSEIDDTSRRELEELNLSGCEIKENISFSTILKLILPTLGAKRKLFVNDLPPASLRSQMIIIFGALIKERRAQGTANESMIASLTLTRNAIAESHKPLFPYEFWSWEKMLPFEEVDDSTELFDIHDYVTDADIDAFFEKDTDPELITVGIDASLSSESLESQEWYEENFYAEGYEAIISLVKDSDSMSFIDAYYYGLALLRTGNYDLAFSAYEFLLCNQTLVDEMSQGEWFSTTVNYLTAALLSRRFRAYQEFYDELDDEDREDEDIRSLHEAYEKMILSGADNIVLEFAPGYPL